jgi:uncharacterized membrane protein YccC
MRKKGASLRIISAMVGIILVLLAVYYIINEELIYGSVFGIFGVLIIALSLMVYKR